MQWNRLDGGERVEVVGSVVAYAAPRGIHTYEKHHDPVC